MARLYLIIIVVGVFIGAMLPSGSPTSKAPLAAPPPGHEVLVVDPHRSAATSVAMTTPVPGGLGTTLDRGPNGHFFVDAQVNGATVHFLIDTGASGVALTADDARRAGLQFSTQEFTPVGSGASGEVRGKLVSLDHVSLGGRQVDNVSGVILEGGEMSLLGQSFLSQMGTIEISGDRMTIR